MRGHRDRVQHQLHADLRVREEQQENRRILRSQRRQTEEHHSQAEVDRTRALYASRHPNEKPYKKAFYSICY